MSDIKFSDDEKKILVNQIQNYFDTELDHPIGDLGAELFLDFISEKFGAYYYNRGLYDAQALFARKLDDFSEAIYEIEQPTSFSR